MIEVGDVSECRKKVEEDTRKIWEKISAAAQRRSPEDVLEVAVAGLASLRREIYEELNQIQHEFAILRALEWYLERSAVPIDVVWLWNPRATGGITEPDLAGRSSGKVFVSAEITTSHHPQGIIGQRMSKTLAKLAAMQGQLFYFVNTPAMAQAARSRVARAAYNIKVVDLSEKRGLA